MPSAIHFQIPQIGDGLDKGSTQSLQIDSLGGKDSSDETIFLFTISETSQAVIGQATSLSK